MAAETKVGDRVRLIRCTEPYTRLLPGTVGTVKATDHAGTVQVTWDDGTTLGCVPGVDKWEVVAAGA